MKQQGAFSIAFSFTLFAIAGASLQETNGVCSGADGCLPEIAQGALLQVKQVTHKSEGSPENPEVSLSSPENPEVSLTTASEGTNPSGAAAPLTQDGYAAVADRCCQAEMEQFINRVAFDLDLDVCSIAGIRGLAPYHTCEKGPQTYNDLTAQLLENTKDRCSAFASTGACTDLPADCPNFNGSTVPDCHCSASKAVTLDFSRAYLGQNNLGGAGPDSGVQEMRYINIFAKAFPIRWSTHTDKCVDVKGGKYENGATVVIYRCVNDGTHFNMQWTLPASGTGVIRWTPHPDKCFQVAGGSTANRANLELWDCDEANPNQQWITPASGNGPIKWATHPTKCIDVDDGGLADHTNIQLYDCGEGNTNQQWTLPKVSEATDLLITAINSYDSPSNSPDTANNMKNGFGSFKIRKGTSTDFKFRFVESGTSTPRTIEEFHLAFFDIDKETRGAEFLSGKGYKGYITDVDTTLSASVLPSGRTKFSGTKSVANPAAPGTATDAQRRASVMFFFENTSEFEATFGFEAATGQGPFSSTESCLLLFSGSSVLVDRCAA